MRRSLSARILAVVFAAMISVPAFASAPRDDSPFDRFERVFSRIVKQIRKIVHPITVLDELQVPKG